MDCEWWINPEVKVGEVNLYFSEFDVAGPGLVTTIGFLRRVLDHQTFRDGQHSTRFVDDLLARADGSPAEAKDSAPPVEAVESPQSDIPTAAIA